MDFELRGSLFSLHYRWRAAPSLSVNGIKWHRLLLLFFPMILFPRRSPEERRAGTLDVCVWGRGGGSCSMPELNSTSPLSNSQAAALTSPTRPLELSWQPGVPHTHARTHTSHTVALRGPRPDCNTIPICCTTMPYSSVLITHTPPQREHPFLFLFEECIK